MPLSSGTAQETEMKKATFGESSLVYILAFYVISFCMVGALLVATECLLSEVC